ncbi:MAG: ATP-dependent sacrificial sulfur transferase LarE [Saccharofermentans sp.]|nr:ATP-dependent sacrificial sulfur transferase LarE [Saccharofermentans sp.]
MLTGELQLKLDRLKEYIRGLGSLAVGFSGGVDSTFLVSVAHSVLGDSCIAVICADAAIPAREVESAVAFCGEHGIFCVLSHFDPLGIEEFRLNVPDRCYYCKRGVFQEIKRVASGYGITYVAEGSNMDDLGDYRPGLRAVSELCVVSPLREAGLTKADIRAISREMGLPTWSKPSYACMATRVAYGEEITVEKLRMIEQAEQFLGDLGFNDVRVRMHGSRAQMSGCIARIEVAASDIARLAADGVRETVSERLKEIGFVYVAVDLNGYKMGNMNSTLGV